MRFSSKAALASALPLALAQTFTSCNPTEKSCPADPGLNAATFKSDFTKGAPASWTQADGTYLKFGGQGAEFTISEQGNAPTIQTDFYFLFGRVDVVVRASPGGGVISSIVLESDDLDEIDWEFVGADTSHVQSNYFGKGNTTTYDRVKYVPVASPMDTFHTYTLDWTADRLQYIIDGTLVRTLNYQDAVGGKNYPQTPMRVKLGSWTAPNNAPGTLTWAGGPVNWADAPFTMYVQSVSIQNYNPADSYAYGDLSGSWQSIKINGKSGASNSASAVGTGSAVSSVAETATSAPTSALSVSIAQNTKVAASSTVVVPVSIGTGSASVTSATSATARSNYTTTSSSVTAHTSTGAAAALSNSWTAGSIFVGVAAIFFTL